MTVFNLSVASSVALTRIPVAMQIQFMSHSYFGCGQARVHSGGVRLSHVTGLAALRLLVVLPLGRYFKTGHDCLFPQTPDSLFSYLIRLHNALV
jgi:hypothetical protein